MLKSYDLEYAIGRYRVNLKSVKYFGDYAISVRDRRS